MGHPYCEWTSDFSAALAGWREHGGAMLYDAGQWFAAPAEEIESRTIDSARSATFEALRRGGLSTRQIAAELGDWTDPAGPPAGRRPCGTCKWWTEPVVGASGERFGLCRACPPAIIKASRHGVLWGWPTTAETDYCGHWTRLD